MTYYCTYEDQEYEEYVEYQIEDSNSDFVFDEPIYEYPEESRTSYKIPCKAHRCYSSDGQLNDVYYLQTSFSPVYTSQKYTNHSKLYVQLHNECAAHYEESEAEDELEENICAYEDETNFSQKNNREKISVKRYRRNSLRPLLKKKSVKKLKKPDYVSVSNKADGDYHVSADDNFSVISSDKSGVVRETCSGTSVKEKVSTVVNLRESKSAKFSVDKRLSMEGKEVKQSDSTSRIPEISDQVASLPETKTKFHSIANVKSIVEENTASGEMVGWRNRSIPDSTTETSMILSAASNDIKVDKNLTGTISSDCCTNVTINSDEYREFIEQINKIPQMTREANGNKTQASPQSESSPPVGIGTLLKSFYDSTNNSTKMPDITLTNGTAVDSKSDPAATKPAGNRRRNKRLSFADKKRDACVKVNPLCEVPLIHMFKWAMPAEDHGYKYKKRAHNDKGSNNSIMFKVFRFVVNIIDRFQSFAYRYALRYILFI